MKRIILLTLLTLYVQTTFCQNLSDTVNVEYSKNSPRKFSIGYGIPISELGFIFSPNLNNYLKSNNIESSGCTYFSIPVNIIYQEKRFKGEIGIDYPILTTNNNSKQFSSVKTSAGYAIFADRNHFTYFNIGIGVGTVIQKIDFNPTQKPIVSLASVIQSGVGQTITLRNQVGFLDINIETMMRAKNNKSLGRSIKLGYYYGFTENPYMAKSVKLVDAPSDRLNGFYLQATLNITNQRKARKKTDTQNSSNQ